ncbi:MAG: SRPBCC family protein [Acidobacteriota bacterium]
MQDKIEKSVDLKAPVPRVWRALTDHREFGAWFRVDLENPFTIGEVTAGRVTHPECDHLQWAALVRAIEPERYFAFSWCPLAQDADFDKGPTTLVEFTLTATQEGTRLEICESGFGALPAGPRNEALRSNTRGWNEQVHNIAAHVAA